MGIDDELISVIVPIYNIERYIGWCIESIINQEYKNLEIILVDDGSPDRCPEICDLYAQKDDRITVIHKENGGLVSARKAGLAVSHGKYIGYVDGDDWLDKDFYSSLFFVIKNNDADAVVAGYKRDFFGKRESFINSIPVGVYEDQQLELFFSKMISFDTYYRPGIFTYVWNKLFRREVLYANQMKVDDRISIGEDAACVFPTLLDCKRVCVIDNSAYHYRQREDSMLKKSEPFEKEAPKLILLYNYLITRMKDKLRSFNLKQQIIDFVLSVFIIRSGGILPQNSKRTNSFPFQIEIRGRRVAIYSAGTFGQQMVKRNFEAVHCEVVNWVDDDYWEYRRCCLNVNPVDSLVLSNFEYVLIATVDGGLAEEMRKILLATGVPESAIIGISCNQTERAWALQSYLSNWETLLV